MSLSKLAGLEEALAGRVIQTTEPTRLHCIVYSCKICFKGFIIFFWSFLLWEKKKYISIYFGFKLKWNNLLKKLLFHISNCLVVPYGSTISNSLALKCCAVMRDFTTVMHVTCILHVYYACYIVISMVDVLSASDYDMTKVRHELLTRKALHKLAIRLIKLYQIPEGAIDLTSFSNFF